MKVEENTLSNIKRTQCYNGSIKTCDELRPRCFPLQYLSFISLKMRVYLVDDSLILSCMVPHLEFLLQMKTSYTEYWIGPHLNHDTI